MLTRFRKFFSQPVFPDDEDKTRLARVLNTILLGSLAILLVLSLIAVPFLFHEKFLNSLSILVVFVIVGFSYGLMKRGKVKLASSLYSFGIWLTFTLFIPFSGGVHSLLLIFYVLGTVVTGLLLGTRGALIQVIGSSLAILVMAIMESSGRSFPRIFPLSPIVSWLDITTVLFITMLVVDVVTRSLREALFLTSERLREQRHAENAVRDSEEKFRILFETSRDFSYISTLDGRIADFSKAAISMTGYSEEELRTIKIQDIYYDPEIRNTILEKIQEQGYVENLEVKGKRKNGTLIDTLFNGIAVKDKSGNLIGLQGSIKDISERKQSEEALRSSEEKFRGMIEQASDGFALIDEDCRLLEWNKAMERIWGLKRETVVGLPFYDIQFQVMTPEHRTPQRYENLKNTIIQAVSTGQSPIFNRVLEAELTHPDGKRIYINQRVFPIRTEGSIRVGSMTQDVTERKLAEERIARQVEHLRALQTIEQAILSSMDLKKILELLVREVVKELHVDAVDFLLFDPGDQKLNFAAGDGFKTKALQYTSLEVGAGLAGRAAQHRRTIHISNLGEVNDNPVLSQAIAGEEFVSYYAVPLVAKDQLHGVLELFHRQRLDPDPDWLSFLEALARQAAISIDNARMLEKTQQGLMETNALYQINQDLAASIEADQLMDHVVELLQKNFNYHYVQIFTTDPSSGDIVMRAGSGEIGKQLKQRNHRLAPGEGIVGFTAETGMPFFSNNVEDVLFFVKDPLLPDVKSELSVPIRTGNDFLGLLDVKQVPPAVLTERDLHLVCAVADQLAMSLQKARLYSDLQDALRQEQATRAQLIHSERLAIAGRLLASVSHELNNPLQAIQNALFLLKDESTISLQGRQDLNIVLAETERMATMLERLRTTYRPLHEEDFHAMQVNSIIDDVYALMATHLRHHHITYQFVPDQELPLVQGLPDQLKQVILNLFMNSVEAMNQGGCLSVTTLCLRDCSEIQVTIKDTGEGIDPAILPNIFEAFITNKEGGTGLGLAIVYEIVTKHGGRIRAENCPEGGAKFTVNLPFDSKGG